MTAPFAFAAASPALRAQLLAFNVLPSRQLHASRMAPWQQELQALGELASRPALQRVLHRRWSGRLQARWGSAATPVADLSHPALPLALAEQALLERLVRDAGLVLLGARLRRTVVRTEVLAVRAAFGSEALQWVLSDAAHFHPGLTDCSDWLHGSSADDYARAAEVLGSGLVAQGWQDAPPGLRLRADGRLAAEADEPAVRAASGLDARRARDLCLQLLGRLDSTWISSFPTTR